MKKIYLIILLISMLFISACSTKVVNEIYNITYEGTVSLEDFEELTQAVIKKTEGSVVTVFNYGFSIGSLVNNGTGSGVVYEAKALLRNGTVVDAKEAIENKLNVKKFQYRAITNYHVIENAYSIEIASENEFETITANVVANNKLLDLSILSFETSQYFSQIEFADTEQLKKGSFVIAIGSPYGINFEGSASFGIVSYPKRYLEDESGAYLEYIQHDAAINPGNSGGALVNMKGQLVGINTLKMDVENDKTEGMGFAIPANVVKEFINGK